MASDRRSLPAVETQGRNIQNVHSPPDGAPPGAPKERATDCRAGCRGHGSHQTNPRHAGSGAVAAGGWNYGPTTPARPGHEWNGSSRPRFPIDFRLRQNCRREPQLALTLGLKLFETEYFGLWMRQNRYIFVRKCS